MDSTDLTREQAERLHETMGRLHQYFRKLEQRLEALQFDRTDKFFRLVFEAHNLMHSLSMETHYMKCDSGVGRPRRKDAAQLTRARVVLWGEPEPESE